MQIMVIIHSDKTIVCSMQTQNEILGIPHRSHKNKILIFQLNQIQIFPVGYGYGNTAFKHTQKL